MLGLLLSLGATVSTSLGNITSARNQMSGLPVIQANAWGMSYGTVLMIAAALLFGKEFTFKATVPYIGSLVYLSLFGSVFAFGMYLTLIGRIGADRAAYTTLLFPIVALALSMAFEGYRGSAGAIVGIGMILLGNWIVLKKVPRTRYPVETLRPEDQATERKTKVVIARSIERGEWARDSFCRFRGRQGCSDLEFISASRPPPRPLRLKY